MAAGNLLEHGFSGQPEPTRGIEDRQDLILARERCNALLAHALAVGAEGLDIELAETQAPLDEAAPDQPELNPAPRDDDLGAREQPPFPAHAVALVAQPEA